MSFFRQVVITLPMISLLISACGKINQNPTPQLGAPLLTNSLSVKAFGGSGSDSLSATDGNGVTLSGGSNPEPPSGGGTIGDTKPTPQPAISPTGGTNITM